MEEKIQRILNVRINPILDSHFGGADLVSYENNIAYVKLSGVCSACPSARNTFDDIVKDIIIKDLPEVKDVVLDTSVDNSLLEFAKRILKK